MKFYENYNPVGHIEVWKHFPDGNKELHFADDNVITSGMGATLAQMFDADKTADVQNFQIPFFCVGSGGGPTGAESAGYLQVSSTGDLGEPLTRAQYGNGNLQMSLHYLISNGTKSGSTQPFGMIPHSYIKRVTPTKCMWQIVLDEQTCNITDTQSDSFINEIGLYSKNPYLEATDASFLCAYRYFKPVYKTDAFILVFRWTIEF